RYCRDDPISPALRTASRRALAAAKTTSRSTVRPVSGGRTGTGGDGQERAVGHRVSADGEEQLELLVRQLRGLVETVGDDVEAHVGGRSEDRGTVEEAARRHTHHLAVPGQPQVHGPVGVLGPTRGDRGGG